MGLERMRRWRRLGIVVVAVALATGAGGTMLAQSPSPTPTPTQPPARTSTLANQPSQPTPPPGAVVVPTPSPTPGPRPPATPVVTPVAVAMPSPGASSAPGTTPLPAVTPTPGGSPAPAGSPAPGSSPAPAGSPAPTPTPSAPPPPVLTDQGITVAGVFGADIDGMVTPADEFQIVALVRAPGVERVTLRMSGAPFLTARKEFELQPGDNWLQIADFKVDTELEPSIREEVIRKVGGTIPLRDGALVLAVDFVDASGAERTASFQPEVREFLEPGKLMRVEYPDLKRATGMPPDGPSGTAYYLRGDADFHHPDDFNVRKLAIEAGRLGRVFPDDPGLVTDNIFTFINTILGDGEPGDFNNDYNLARLIDDGTVARGRLNGAYICIGQTYFMTALTRTLGMPSRELNIAVGRPNWLGNDGLWRVTWWQEGAVQVWYNEDWQHYDLWLGFKGLDGYFRANLAYQAWAAYAPQATMFMTNANFPTGLRGHDFNLFPGEPPHFEFVGEAVKPGVRVQGLEPEEAPVTRGVGGPSFYRSVDAPRGPSGEIGRPPAMGISSLPETRP